MARLVPGRFFSDPRTGQIGSLEYNIWLAHVTGVPLLGIRNNTFVGNGIIFVYGALTISASLIYTGFEIYDLYLCWPDFDAFTQNFSLSLCHIAGALKMMNIFYRLPDLKRIIDKLKLATCTHVLSDVQCQVFQSGELQNKILLTLYAFMVGLTGFSAMILLFLNPSMAGKMFPYRVTLPSWLPFGLQVFYMGFTAFIFALQIVTIDFLNVVIMNLIRFHLNILNLAFNELIVDYPANGSSQKLTAEDRSRHLRSIVQHHCILIELHNEVENLFRLPVLIQLFTSLIICAVTGLRATVQASSTNSALIIYFYGFCIFSELFFYCWFGNVVLEQSKTLATSGYSASWYDFDASFRRDLLIFMTNAQRPFVFTAAGFMGLTLTSFASILSKAYSFLAVLRQMYDL